MRVNKIRPMRKKYGKIDLPYSSKKTGLKIIRIRTQIKMPMTMDLKIKINCLYLVVTMFLLYRLLKKKTTTMINENIM